MAGNLIANYLVNHKEKKREKGVTYMTTHREFSISILVDIKFVLPEFSMIKEIKLILLYSIISLNSHII